MKPDPPEAMKLPGNENAIRAYINAENEYAGKWLDQFSALRKKIIQEVTSRQFTVPDDDAPGNDSVFNGGGPWKIKVTNKKEAHLVSSANHKEEDRVIYTENDPDFNISLRISSSKNYIFIESTGPGSSEVRFLQISLKPQNPVLIQKRKPGVVYRADHFGGNTIWIITNENAPNRCILIAGTHNPDPAKWKAAVRENDSVYIDDYSVINLKYLVLVQKKHLSTSIEITDLYAANKSGKENRINFPEPEGRISGLYYDNKEDKIVFRYSSMITPPTLYTYGVHSMHMGIRWKKRVKNYTPDDYKAGVIRVKSNNNVPLPVSLIRKRDLEKMDGTNPLVIFIDSGKPREHGEGFNPGLLSLLDRGFYIARVHLPYDISDREGSDAIKSVVLSLSDKKYTSPGQVTIEGNGHETSMIIRTAKENPSYFRTLVINSPAASGKADLAEVPFTYLHIDPQSPDKGSGSLIIASAMRKNLKSVNTLLVSTDNEPDIPEKPSPGQITFILASYGIKQ